MNNTSTPQDVNILSTGTREYTFLHGRKEFVNMIKLRILGWGINLDYILVDPMWSQESLKLKDEDRRIRVRERLDNVMLPALKMEETFAEKLERQNISAHTICLSVM